MSSVFYFLNLRFMKDWIWNSKSSYVCNWATSHSEWEREKYDYYATNPKTIDDLFKKEIFSKNILEPSCWEGHLSKKIEEYNHKVYSYDLIDRNYWDWIWDFLKLEDYKFEGDIITNPPYKHAKEFIEKSLEIIPSWNKVAMFLKLTFLEWQKRRKFFEKNPPKKILVFSQRQQCAMNGDFDKYKNNAVAYAWYIWEKWFSWKPVIDWI